MTVDGADLPAGRTALLVVDMQNDFCHQDGFYNTRGGRPSEPIARAVPAVGKLLAAARRNGVRVVFTRYVHPEPGDSAAGHGIKPAGWASSEERLRPGSWGAAVVDELAPRTDELVLDKTAYSAFHRTDLEDRLRTAGVRCVVLAGTVTYACVLHTAFDAFVRGFDVVVARDAVTGWFEDLDEAAFRIVELLLGVTVTTDEVVAAFQTGEER